MRDLHELRAAETQPSSITTAGSTSRPASVRIPIARAIDLLAARAGQTGGRPATKRPLIDVGARACVVALVSRRACLGVRRTPARPLRCRPTRRCRRRCASRLRPAARRAGAARPAVPRRGRPDGHSSATTSRGKPVILVLAYYRCPMLCTQVLNGLLRAMRALPFEPATIRRRHGQLRPARDAGAGGAPRRRATSTQYGRPGAARGLALPDRRRSLDRGAHQGGRLPLRLRRRARAVRPRQRHHGADAAGRSLALLLRHRIRPARPAARRWSRRREDKIGSPVDQVLLFCFHYDPSDRQVQRRGHEHRPARAAC